MVPKVSVIVSNHLIENQPYLDRCLGAVMRSDGIDFEVICISSSQVPPEVPQGVKFFHKPELDNATKKVHWAIENAVHPQSEYFMLLSDDVMLSKVTLAGLVHGTRGQDLICHPRSNNENGSRYFCDISISLNAGGQVFRPGPSCSLEDIQGLESAVLRYPLLEEVLISVPWVSFFATLIPRTVWNRVGLLDERLDARHNDEDYCYRAAQLKIPTLINMGVFALHFGSKTLPKVTTPEQLQTSTDVFLKKWSIGNS